MHHEFPWNNGYLWRYAVGIHCETHISLLLQREISVAALNPKNNMQLWVVCAQSNAAELLLLLYHHLQFVCSLVTNKIYTVLIRHTDDNEVTNCAELKEKISRRKKIPNISVYIRNNNARHMNAIKSPFAYFNENIIKRAREKYHFIYLRYEFREDLLNFAYNALCATERNVLF